MNVASLLQDSPSDDRESRLQRNSTGILSHHPNPMPGQRRSSPIPSAAEPPPVHLQHSPPQIPYRTGGHATQSSPGYKHATSARDREPNNGERERLPPISTMNTGPAPPPPLRHRESAPKLESYGGTEFENNLKKKRGMWMGGDDSGSASRDRERQERRRERERERQAQLQSTYTTPQHSPPQSSLPNPPPSAVTTAPHRSPHADAITGPPPMHSQAKLPTQSHHLKISPPSAHREPVPVLPPAPTVSKTSPTSAGHHLPPPATSGRHRHSPTLFQPVKGERIWKGQQQAMQVVHDVPPGAGFEEYAQPLPPSLSATTATSTQKSHPRTKPGSTAGRSARRSQQQAQAQAQHQAQVHAQTKLTQSSPFEPDWEIREANEREKRLQPPAQQIQRQYSRPVSPTAESRAPPPLPNATTKKRSATPVVLPKVKQKPYNLGTFVYPSSPFPLSLPSHLIYQGQAGTERDKQREVHFTLYIPKAHLPTSVPPGPHIWGGRSVHSNGKGKIYTDDSSLTLLPLHVGLTTISEYRRARGDLKVTYVVVPRARCPVKWVGLMGVMGERERDKDRVQSFSWGNGHDGGGLEVLNVEWVKPNTAHSLSHPNRRARLRDYAERRATLIPISINAPWDDYGPRICPGDIDEDDSQSIMSEMFQPPQNLHRYRPDVPFTSYLRNGEGKPCFRDCAESQGSLVFEMDGSIAYLYTPATLSQALFPLPSPSLSQQTTQNQIGDPSVYLSDRERPKKKRKLDNGAPFDGVDTMSEVLEVETDGGDAVVFSRDPSQQSDENAEEDLVGKRWNVAFVKREVKADAAMGRPNGAAEVNSDDGRVSVIPVIGSAKVPSPTSTKKDDGSNESTAMSISSSNTPVTTRPASPSTNSQSEFPFQGLTSKDITFEDEGICIWTSLVVEEDGDEKGRRGLLVKAKRWKWKSRGGS